MRRVALMLLVLQITTAISIAEDLLVPPESVGRGVVKETYDKFEDKRSLLVTGEFWDADKPKGSQIQMNVFFGSKQLLEIMLGDRIAHCYLTK